ncbi:MAG: hypothetical protein J0L83_02520 [Chitinophagales bacterium]|nr:hypothetical protein [Chitinophagales bacterium]
MYCLRLSSIKAVGFFGLLLAAMPLMAQKTDCLEGNCKNGYGVRRVESPKNPLPGGIANTGYQMYVYYELGDFVKGKLNGKGYRFSKYSYTFSDKQLIDAFRNGTSFVPDPQKYQWFEKGEYVDGLLNGKGFLIEYDTRNNIPNRIREGNFQAGLLHGTGTKFVPRGYGQPLRLGKDSITGAYTLIEGKQLTGNYQKDICYDCTLVEKQEYLNKQGTMTGWRLDENFLTGWVLTDYEIPQFTITINNLPMSKALYIGGYKVTTLKSFDISARIDTVNLGGLKKYIGEVDHEGKPYGFGTIMYGGVNDSRYEGFVDDAIPNGYGYFIGNGIMGGEFVNGKFIKGAIFDRSDLSPRLRLLYSTNDIAVPDFNTYTREIVSGGYEDNHYAYEDSYKGYKLSRQTTGKRIDGFEKDAKVNFGFTPEERRKNRKVIDGQISFSDLLIGDVVLENGIASPVEKVIGGLYYLKNGKYVSGYSTDKVRLSKHSLSEFAVLCTVCKGSARETYMYQRSPELVRMPRLVTETVVMDYTIWKKTSTVYDEYTKTYAPEKRTRQCAACNGMGKTKDVKEMVE